jgi:hypothetical protein
MAQAIAYAIYLMCFFLDLIIFHFNILINNLLDSQVPLSMECVDDRIAKVVQ